jgi:hypothetical protein
MMGMGGSCCHFNHQNSAVEAIPLFSPEHTHQLTLAAHLFLQLHALDDPTPLAGISALPLPTASPGRTTILRI